jgi:hypothetical protein
MAQGHDESSAYAICKASLYGAKTAKNPISKQEIRALAAMSWDECISEATKKGADDPEALCGWLKHHGPNAKVGSKVVHPKAEPTTATTRYTNPDGRLYVKAFLIDDSLNLNKWAVTPDSIPKNINTFIGKPLVLTEKFDHPQVPETERLDHWLAYQEAFRVGTIVDIVSKNNPVTNSTGYYAVIEVTNDHLKQALRDNSVPIYVSPAIAEPAFGSSGANYPDANIANWQGVHLAVVDEPAYGINRARITEMCGGDSESCLLQLRKAHLAKYGANNCGFCVKKAINRLQIIHQAKVNAKINSQFQNKTGLVQKKHLSSQLESVSGSENSEVPNKGTELNSQTPTESAAPIQTQQQPYAVTKQAVPQSMTDLVQENQRLLQKVELLTIKNEELSNVKDTLGERIAALELQSRREKIERIITAEVIRDDKQRLDKIKSLVASSIPLQEIEDLYNGLKVTLRKASISTGRSSGSRVPYYASASTGNSSIITSSPPNQNVPDEETGLTPLQKQLAVLEGGL